MTEIRSGGEPLDRLTMLAGVAIDAIGAHPQASGREQVVVLVAQQAGEADDAGMAEFDHGLARAGFAGGAAGTATVIDLLLAYAEALGQTTGRVIRIIPLDSN